MLQRLLKVNVVYAVGSVANGAALFLLIPFLVKYLGIVDFGLWSISEIAIYFLRLVTMAGMDLYLMRVYWFLKSELERRSLVGTILSMVVLWGLGILVLFIVAAFLLSKNGVFFNEFNPTLLLLIGAIGFCEVVFNLLLSIFRIREKPFHFVFLSLGRMITFMGISIFWVKTGVGLSGALAGRLAAAIFFIFFAWGMAYKYVQIGFSSEHLKPWSKYGLPMVLSGVAFYALIAADRYALQAMAGLQMVAIYSFSYKLASSIDYLVTSPFATDWAARRFQIATEDQPKRKYANAAFLYAFIAILCGFFVQAGAPLLYDWFAPSIYIDGLKALPILLAANIVMGLSYPLNIGIFLKDRPKFLPVIVVLSGIFYIIALVLLIPLNPIQGAAWATLLSYSVYTISIAFLSLRLYPVDYPVKGWIVLGICILLSSAGLLLLGFVTFIDTLWISALAGELWVFLVFALTGYFLWKRRIGFVSPEISNS